jgi:ribosomal protein L30E
MLDTREVRAFSLLPEPVLTVYLDTNPSKMANRGPAPEYLSWLNAAGKSLVASVPAGEQKLLQEQLGRIEGFLRDRVLPQRGMLLFAGPQTWQPVPLQVEVGNEVHWGRPALAQLLGLLSRHKPYGIAVVTLNGARLFRYHLGEMTELEEKKFVINISQWRKKDMGKFAHVDITKSRGTDHDTFERRIDDQYRHICAETAQRARQLSETHGLAAFFLVGDDRLIDPIAAAFPRDLQSHVVKIEEDLAKVVQPEIVERLEPHIEEWERARQSETIGTLLRSKRGVVLGVAETLAELQNGRVRALVLAADLDPELRQCPNCGRADLTDTPVCLYCGTRRQIARLREILSELAWKHSAEIEIVDAEASARLREAGGMGGWLRLPKQKSARRAARRAG